MRTRESKLQCTIDSLRDELDAKQGLVCEVLSFLRISSHIWHQLQKFQNLHLDQRSSDHSGARKPETVEEQVRFLPGCYSFSFIETRL